jgi:Histidine kinase-, DNA gyrase B-, and HSP90-like ATPase
MLFAPRTAALHAANFHRQATPSRDAAMAEDGRAGLDAVVETRRAGWWCSTGRVPPEEQPQLLRRRYRASNARHSGIPGTGLGLATSRAIIERHRGTITLTRAEPAGTSVTVRLPTTGAVGTGRRRNW